MGSGKSTVGEVLAKLLDCNFIDLDRYIEEKYKKSISLIFSEKGEEYFRNIESEALYEISNTEMTLVISTGGGVVLSESNWNVMNSNGKTVYLEAGLETIWERIKGDESRPLLNVKDPKGEAEKLLASRIQLYKKSDFTVNTDNLSSDQVADEIYKIIKNSD